MLHCCGKQLVYRLPAIYAMNRCQQHIDLWEEYIPSCYTSHIVCNTSGVDVFMLLVHVCVCV